MQWTDNWNDEPIGGLIVFVRKRCQKLTECLWAWLVFYSNLWVHQLPNPCPPRYCKYHVWSCAYLKRSAFFWWWFLMMKEAVEELTVQHSSISKGLPENHLVLLMRSSCPNMDWLESCFFFFLTLVYLERNRMDTTAKKSGAASDCECMVFHLQVKRHVI